METTLIQQEEGLVATLVAIVAMAIVTMVALALSSQRAH